MFHPASSKATVCAFASSSLIVTGHESGKVALYDYRTGEEVVVNERAHSAVVTDLQLAPDRSYFITSSKDKMARVGFKYYLQYQAFMSDFLTPLRFTMHERLTS